MNLNEDQQRVEQERKERSAKVVADAVSMLERIRIDIKPLQFEPFQQGLVRGSGQELRRNVITADGEIVGRVETMGVWSSYSSRRYRLSSGRIPRRNRRGYRDYKKLDSLAAAIVKFCMPVSGDEKRATVLREEIRYFERRRGIAWNRTRGALSWRAPSRWHEDDPDKADYTQPRFDTVIAGLAKDEPEAHALLRVLVNKKRVYDRFDAFIDERYLNERRAELEALDLANETIHT